MDCNAETMDTSANSNRAMEPTRTSRDLRALRNEERLRDTLNLPARQPITIHGPGKRSPQETARLIAELESKTGIERDFATGNPLKS
jgi:hypothetical protein